MDKNPAPQSARLHTIYRMLDRRHQRMLTRKAIALVYSQRWESERKPGDLEKLIEEFTARAARTSQ